MIWNNSDIQPAPPWGSSLCKSAGLEGQQSVQLQARQELAEHITARQEEPGLPYLGQTLQLIMDQSFLLILNFLVKA